MLALVAPRGTVIVTMSMADADAVADHVADSRALSSVTTTGPSAPEIVVPGAPLPRVTLTGALIDRAPVVTVKVTVVSGSPPFEVVDECASTACPNRPPPSRLKRLLA